MLFRYMIALLLSFCGKLAHAQKRFEVNGLLSGAPSGTKVFLLQMNGEIDSTTINNEKFYFKGNWNGTEPSYALLVLDDIKNLENVSARKTLWIDTAVIALRGDYGQFGKARITGSIYNTDNQKLESYLNRLEGMRIENEKLQQRYHSAAKNYYALPPEKRNKAAADSISHLAVVSVNSSNTYDSLKTKLIVSFLEKNRSSYTALLEIYNRRSRLPYPQLRSLFGRSDPALKKSAYGRLLLEYINNFKGLTIGDEAPDFTLNDLNGNPVNL
ncbi:MAG TPA: DUF4369 domain-containing protein, partial [Niastella sp.]